MKLQITTDSKRIVITDINGNERKKLNHFPGLFQDGPYFFIKTDNRIVFNIINRLRARFSNIQLDKNVMELYQADFDLKSIPDEFHFFTQPKDFQSIALRYCYTVGGGGLLLEPGMGKTKVVWDFIALMEFLKSIIVCPVSLLFVWEEERDKHRPDKSIYIAETTDWKVEKEKAMAADVFVLNYNKAVIFAERLLELKPEFIGVDEALIKDPSSERTRILTWLSYRIQYKMLMSGTLVNNSPRDVFAPVRFLEPCLVGTGIQKFNEEYAVFLDPKKKQIVVGYRNIPEIKSILESVSIVMTKEQWLKLPAKKFHDIRVQLSDEQRTFYQHLQSNYIATTEDGRDVEISNALTALTKLIQISNGFVYINKEADIEAASDLCVTDTPVKKKLKRETYFFKEQPKLDALIELLNRIPERRCMIWFNMSAEYELIMNRLNSEGKKFLTIKGGEKDTGGKVKLFNSDSSYMYLVCQAKSVNYGITVLGLDCEDDVAAIATGVTPEVFTQIFYSLNFSLETYLQQIDRIHRLGQEHECDYFRLISNTDAEKNVVEKLDLKLSIRGQILIDIVKSLGINLV